MKYDKLSKKALACMYVKTAVQFAVISVLIVFLSLTFGEKWPKVVTGILYAGIGIDFLYFLISPKIRYERYRYRLTEEELEVKRGLLVIETEIVPIERLHKIEVSSGPFFQAFGLKEVLVTTAGGDVRVSYLENEVADQIAKHLKKRINTIAKEERNIDAEEAARIAYYEDREIEDVVVVSNDAGMEETDGKE